MNDKPLRDMPTRNRWLERVGVPLALLVGAAGVVLGGVALTRSPVATAPVTVTATPRSPTATAEDTHTAAVTACAAARDFHKYVNGVRTPYVLAASEPDVDWASPSLAGLAGQYFGGVVVELEYLSERVSTATPEAIQAAITGMRHAAIALAHAELKRVHEEGQTALDVWRTSDDTVNAACTEAGVPA